jgi:hypothetical protein
MKKVLLLTLCVVFAMSAVASAGILTATGQAFVFGIFGAPPPAIICWKECNNTVLIGDNTGQITGDRCITTDACGNFTFHLDCKSDVVRLGTGITGDATYLGGMFHVCGKSATFDVKCGPAQDTSIVGKIVINMY